MTSVLWTVAWAVDQATLDEIETVQDYGKMCADEIATIPDLSCSDELTEVIPIEIGGVPIVDADPSSGQILLEGSSDWIDWDGTCDKPAWLGGR